MTFTVTGATGMIGRALVALLLREGHQVLAILRPHRRALLQQHPALTVIEADLAAYPSLSIPATADIFIHLAWCATIGEGRDDPDLQLSNVMAAAEAVRLAKRLGCRRFVGVGSQAECGPLTAPLRGDTPAAPQSCYGAAKLAAAHFTRTLCASLEMEHLWVRLLSVYGEGDSPRSLISYLLRCCAEKTPPKLTPCGQIWDYLYAEDAASALLSIAEKGHNGMNYAVGSGIGRPLADYVRELRDLAAPGLPLHFGALPYPPHQQMFLVANLTALSAHTGFCPTISFGEGIGRLLAAKGRG